MDRSEHLTVDDLILFVDRELHADAVATAEQHLLNCTDCAKRLRSLKSGGDAYVQYREQVLEPALSVPTAGWARPSQFIEEKRHHWGWIWVVACAGWLW